MNKYDEPEQLAKIMALSYTGGSIIESKHTMPKTPVLSYDIYTPIKLNTVPRSSLRAYVRYLNAAMLRQGILQSEINHWFNKIIGYDAFYNGNSVSFNINGLVINDTRKLYLETWAKLPNLARTIPFDVSPALSSLVEPPDISITHGEIMETTVATGATPATIAPISYTAEEKNPLVKKATSDGESVEDMVAIPKSIADVSFKPEYETALDSLLTLSSEGKITSIKTLMADVRDIVKDNALSKASIRKMKTELSRKAVAFETKTHDMPKSTSSGVPNGKFKTVLASDVFGSPTGKKSTVLNFEVPMFEWEDDHPEVPNVDPNYIFNPESLISFLYGLVTNKNTWLHGHTGTGKTTFVEQVAARLNWPVIRVNLDNDIERSDFLGQTQLITGTTGATESKFVEGVLPRAMQSPSIFLIDEMDFGKSGIMYVLQRALESKGLLLTEDGGRLITPHPMFRMVATANTRGQGDELGCYPGARTQSNALLDRFTIWINIDYMESKQEALLLTRIFPDTEEAFIDQLVTFSKEIRKAFVNRELLQSISPRSLMAICDSREFYSNLTDADNSTKLAIKSCYLQRATEDTVAKVNEISARCFSAIKSTTPTTAV